MAETTIGNLTLGAVDGTSLFEQERTDNGSQVSEKVLSSSVANFVGTSHQFAGLNTNTKNLVGAINEAASMGGVVQLTQAEYTALTTAEKMNGSIYKLTDKAIFYCLDEEYHAVKELLTSEYEALSTAEQNNGTIYIQTDAETTGSDIAVSDSVSTSIAEAIDDINSITRLFDYKTIDAGTSAVFNPAPTTYTGATFFGFVGGIGYVALVASTGTNNNITVRDITTGTAFSSQYLTFAWNTSTHEITVIASAGARLFAILDKF